MPPPSAPKDGIVLFEEHPADPAVLEAEIEKRRKAGAPPQELRRLEDLLAAARAFAAADGVSARVPKEKAQAVYDVLRISAAIVASDVAQAIEPPKLVGEETVTPGSPDARVAGAVAGGDPEEMIRLLEEFSDKDWSELSLASVWTLSRALAQNEKFQEAAGRLAPRLSSLEGYPQRGELWLALAQWLLAAGQYGEARGALSRVEADFSGAPIQLARAQELAKAVEALSDAAQKKQVARLLEAQATLEYGTDYTKALAAAEEVGAGAPPGSDLARRAGDLRRAVLARSEERARARISGLWSDFDAGLSLDSALDRLGQMAAQIPGDFAQGLFAKTREDLKAAEVDRKLGRLRDREQRIEALWQKAQSAEQAGRLEEAAQLYRELAGSPRREAALERLAAVIGRLAQSERRKASEQFARALKEKDPAKRLAALELVEGALSGFLEKFPQSPDRFRVEKDLSLVRAEIEKTRKAVEEQKALDAQKAPETPKAQEAPRPPQAGGSPAPEAARKPGTAAPAVPAR